MNWKLSLVYTISIILLCIYSPQKAYVPKITKKSKITMPRAFSQYSRDLRYLYGAYLYGAKHRVSSQDKFSHKTLNLYHLFTPSGLHYSLFFFLISILFRIPFLNQYKKLKISLIFILSFTPYFLQEFYSLKRIGTLKLGLKIKNWYFGEFSYFSLFLFIFSLDFLFGTFTFSPLSFIFSFLFLGIIFAMKDQKQAYWPWAFLGGQLIISYFFNSYQTNIGFYLGYLFTLLFPLVFFFLLCGVISPLLFTSTSFTVLEFYRNLVCFSSELALASGALWPSFPLILCFILPKKTVIISTLLLIHSSPSF